MIQGLLGTSAGAGLKEGERKFSINGVLEGSTPYLSPSPSSSTATNPSSSSSAAATSSENQNLRCPRCDSTNTKFCYYNNYNLTQPRHFCKTCRRYWTKGGALRNVPIGGGCRKSKNNIATSVGKSLSGPAGNLKITVPLDVGKSGFIGGIENEIPLKSNNPNLWPSPQNSHILSLLRTSQNTPSNLNPFPHMSSELAIASAGLNARNNIGLDSPAHVPSIGMCSSFWGNNNSQPHQAQQNQENHQNSFILQGGVVHQNNGFQELYQRLKSSVNYNYPADHHAPPAVLSNLESSTSSSPTILESAPVTAVEYWNPSLSWSDLHLPTTDGAYR